VAAGGYQRHELYGGNLKKALGAIRAQARHAR